IASDLTTGVGCAVVRCTAGFVNVVCHYETTLGNAVKLYNSGPTCNKCPEGTQSCVNGLCPTTEGQCPDVSTSTPTTADHVLATVWFEVLMIAAGRKSFFQFVPL
ncbi:hypothetical protein OESDEN_05163, partial [Oesophagostomum dentatum]